MDSKETSRMNSTTIMTPKETSRMNSTTIMTPKQTSEYNLQKIRQKQTVNYLSLPSGSKLVCDICGGNARFMCKACRAVYYCSESHKEYDHDIIHGDICKQMEFIHVKENEGIVENIQDHASYRERKAKQIAIKEMEVIDIALKRAAETLCFGDPNDALRQVSIAWSFVLRQSVGKITGMIRIITMKVEALVMAEKMSEACREINTVKYLINSGDSTEKVPHAVLADFYKNEGLFYIAKEDYEEARYSFASEIYEAVEAYHTKHTRFAIALFHMGQCLLIENKEEQGYSHYLHAVDIWLEKFTIMFKDKYYNGKPEALENLFCQHLSTKQDVEVKSGEYILHTIIEDTVGSNWQRPRVDSNKVRIAMALVNILLELFTKAKVHASLVKHDPDNFKTVDQVNLAKDIKRIADKEKGRYRSSLSPVGSDCDIMYMSDRRVRSRRQSMFNPPRKSIRTSINCKIIDACDEALSVSQKMITSGSDVTPSRAVTPTSRSPPLHLTTPNNSMTGFNKTPEFVASATQIFKQ